MGTISNEYNEAVSNIHVLLSGTHIGDFTDMKGNFELRNLQLQEYRVEIVGLGFQKQIKTINFSKSKTIHLHIILKESVTNIEEVTIVGKSKTTLIEETGFNIHSIDIKKYQNKSTDAVAILNKTSGVRIRSKGGVGSNNRVSLNGLSGKQIRILVDDIPMDNQGAAYNINNISVNLIDRIDVYKGVVPVHLGVDALGGAINLVTKRKNNSFVDVSYSMGSYNTHRFNVSAQYRNKNNGFTVKLNNSYTYSDNNYTMHDVQYFETKTIIADNKEQLVDREVTGNVERFHDRFKSMFTNVGIGFLNTKWTDEFFVNLAIASVDKQVQGFNNTPIGQAYGEEENKMLRMRYKKSGLLNDRLKIDLFALYNEIKQVAVDTSSRRYRWDGSYRINIVDDPRGERLVDKTFFVADQQQSLYRANLIYKLADTHQFILNHNYSNVSRQGKNTIDLNEEQAFTSPNTLEKAITGLSHASSYFDGNLKLEIGAKYYNIQTLAKQVITFTDQSREIQNLNTKQQEMGYLIASSYFVNPNLLIKASFEKGFRMPEPIEIFGDGLSTASSPTLVPETSYNTNLGAKYTLNFKNGFLKNEIHVFRRNVKNYIRLKFLGLISGYQNDPDVLINGLEYEVSYALHNFKIRSNATWQAVLNNQDYETGSIEEAVFEKEQLPNTPKFFANLNASYNFPDLIHNINTSVYYGINYVDAFYISYEKTALLTNKNEIPPQFLNNFGVTFSTKNKKHNLNLHVENMYNSTAFDNFKQQIPGSAMYVKYRFFLDM
ncbi:putative TonB-dependent outer membrane protein [Polaribacter irgensii 23-P]|uniref:Putative TonB-dependent outer membrane protein n=1 Tax=Polaribacter irgensii 23-P TaxID=313594 RepID=A4C0K7_9FLAO|nr:TonB-dependent receptor [Polaribacter irgensii]EAR12950.1 putative TonB-dependent outer membrane protein [Polaribacter irgensii 23-P]